MTERKDSWKLEDDILLAETVLHHIRVGSTQIKAFEEAAERLERTPSACGFRWNSEVRKRYKEELKEVKAVRKQNKNNVSVTSEEDYLSNYQGDEIVFASPDFKPSETFKINSESFDAAETLDMLKSYIDHLESENKRLTTENEKLRETPKDDLSNLLAILDRAREQLQNKVG